MSMLITAAFIIAVINLSIGDDLARFSEDFIFGASSSSYQVEGGWDADGKGESIWDRATHTNSELIKDGKNGDKSCDSYHNYKRDVEMMKELNLDAYRFSISWPRIIPDGYSGKVNQAGIDHYNNVIDEMLKHNITPVVTLYHWDLPQKIQELGGWTNPLIIDWFENYARIVFDNFGDRVKMWVTINEPFQICFLGYGVAYLAPFGNLSGIDDYVCYRHVALAHAKTYRLYEKEFKAKQGGKVGITGDVENYYGESDSEEDQKIAQLPRDFELGIYLEPIAFGHYPESVENIVAAKSKEQGYSQSRLIPYTEEEKRLLKGSVDFVGLNHYTSRIAYSNESTANMYSEPSMYDDGNYAYYQNSDWLTSSWVALDPESLYLSLKYMAEKFPNVELYVTENGWPTTNDDLSDDNRVSYHKANIKGVLRALNEGINVKGYLLWSLMDNFEWVDGFSTKFGLYKVDFEDPERPRTPRKSALVYKEIVASRVVDDKFNPNVTEL